MLDLEGQQMDDNQTLKELNDFICLLNNDAASLILEDREVLIATVKGAPERLTDVTSRLAQGRKHLRSLVELYEAPKMFVATPANARETDPHA